MAKRLEEQANNQPPAITSLLMNADALESCLGLLDGVAELTAVKAVCREFCCAARRMLNSTDWLAAHLTLHEMLEERLSANVRAAAIASRAAVHPDEIFLSGGSHRLPPLHAAVLCDSSDCVLRALLEAGPSPDFVARRRARGRLAHHVAALHSARASLACLLSVYPQGASQRDSEGCVPLHLAAAGAAAAETSDDGVSKADVADVVSQLLTVAPEATAEADLSGMLPLHHATLHCAPAPVVAALLDVCPEAVHHEASHGWTPLALAITYAQSADVVRVLLERWPDGAAQRIDALDCLPLHLAAKHQARSAIVRLVLAAAPAAAATLDAEGRLPLHVAAASRADAAVVGALLRAHPAACDVPDVDGWMPLHHAAANEAPALLIELLLHAQPRVARTAAPDGRLPLHLAVSHHAPSAAVRALLRIAPETAAQRTSEGHLPLHLASEHGASAATVGALLDVHPAGARERTRLGRLPLQLVARRGIVGTDAEDVSSRRSANGDTVAAALRPAAMDRLPSRAIIGLADSSTTWRADAVLTHH